MTVMLLIVIMVLQWAVIRTDSNIIDLTLVLRDKTLLGLLSAGSCIGLAAAAFIGWTRAWPVSSPASSPADSSCPSPIPC